MADSREDFDHAVAKIQSLWRIRWFEKNNLWGPNIIDISGALFTMSSRISQNKLGAREVNNIWVPEILNDRNY